MGKGKPAAKAKKTAKPAAKPAAGQRHSSQLAKRKPR
jgi:hypothetical protein